METNNPLGLQLRGRLRPGVGLGIAQRGGIDQRPGGSGFPRPLPPTPTHSATWRVAGGRTTSYTDCQGNLWSADENFNSGGLSGNGNTISKALPCATDQALYQNEHFAAGEFLRLFLPRAARELPGGPEVSPRSSRTPPGSSCRTSPSRHAGIVQFRHRRRRGGPEHSRR